MYVLGFACGGIAALPIVGLARRADVAVRLRPLARSPRRTRRALRTPTALRVFVRVLGAPRARRRQRRLDDAIRSELPVIIDLVGVAVAAGCTPYLAIEHAARFGPSRTAQTLRDVCHSCALGQSLDEALRDLGASTAVLRPLTEALRTSARLGSPAAAALARLAADVRADARRRAEARARTVPVRLCFPLVVCVLPAFALLTVAPVVLGGLHT